MPDQRTLHPDGASSWSSDRGTTLTEVLLVLGLSALIVPSLYLAVVSGFRQERVQVSQQAAEVQVQRVSDRLTEDITEQWPSDKRAGAASTELSLEYLDEKGELTRVFWYVDSSSLIRLVVDGASGDTVSKVVLLEEMKIEFRYWTSAGDEITDGRRIASCAVRVTVSLRTAVGGGDTNATFDVAHRTRNPEAEPC